MEQNEQMTRQLERVFDSVLASVNFVLTFLSFLCLSLFVFLSSTQTCQYGDACRFAHGENDNRDLAQLKRRAAGVCYNWSVSHANTPRTAHPSGFATTSSDRISPSPASFFLLFSFDRKESGECKFGESCRFAHEDLPEKEAKIEA